MAVWIRTGEMVVHDSLSDRQLAVVEEAVLRNPALGGTKAHAISTFYEVSAPILYTLNPASYTPSHPLSLEI